MSQEYNFYSNTLAEGRKLEGTCNERAKEQLQAGFQGLEFEPVEPESIKEIFEANDILIDALANSGIQTF
ncbi:MAG: hypothetical protein ACR2PH_12805 [Desulfobulbia bacterium]